jgi:phosphoesterase RecJ-like protein
MLKSFMAIDKKIASQIKKKIDQADTILLSLHRGPDGDSISSNLAMKYFLDKEDKEVKLITPTQVPENFDYLPDTDQVEHLVITNLDYDKFDLIILLDSASWRMVSPRFNKNKRTPVREKVVNIDHHQTNKEMGGINLVVPELASTAEVLYQLFKVWNTEINSQLAQLLLVGVVTDTGVFRYTNTSAQTMKIAADLMEQGADLDQIVFNYLRRNEFNKLKFWGIVLENLERDEENGFAYSFIPFDQAKQYFVDNHPRDYRSGAASVFMAGIKGTEFGIIAIEEEKGELSGSLRSRKDFDVSQIASELGGGGHPGAAGFKVSLPFEEAKNKILKTAKKYT